MNKFKVIQPSASLTPYVKQYWFLTMENITLCSQRLVPLGCTALCFHRGNRIYSSSNGDYLPQSYLYGIATDYTNLAFSGYIDFICIVFQPTGIKAFFKTPLHETNSSYLPLDILNNPELLELEQQLNDATDDLQYVRLIEHFLLLCISQSDNYEDKRINAVINSINRGESNIDRLAEISCLSYKQFKRLFAEHIGTNPKDFLRIMRFQKLHYLLQTHTDMTLEQLAYECGYYDKSHLIKEVKNFSGFSPADLIDVCEPTYSDYHGLFRSAFIDLSYK